MKAVVTGDYGNVVPVRLQAYWAQTVCGVTRISVGSGRNLAAADGLEEVVVQPGVIGGKNAHKDRDLVSVEGGCMV